MLVRGVRAHPREAPTGLRLESVHAFRVVEDEGDRSALAIVPGSRVMQPSHFEPAAPGRNRALRALESERRGATRLVAEEWARTRVLVFVEAGRWYAIHHMWDAEGRFLCWYVNFQVPVRRVPTGFDTFDLSLDLVVAPDRAATLKDEEEFATYVSVGHIRPEEERAVWLARDEVLERAAKERFPFDGSWLDRCPRGMAPVRALPRGWDDLAAPDGGPGGGLEPS